MGIKTSGERGTFHYHPLPLVSFLLSLLSVFFVTMASKILSVFLALTLASPVLSTTVAEKVAQLRLAPTAVDRVKLLQDDSDVRFHLFINSRSCSGN